ncbi:odontogenic ameloblast-associated protein [Sarcophilus harrisii]|uniref:odontogenic ameloblast-associated protein n=1 Tax=Sarcophilus harrisii TaxID=9305 RepID=UPI001301E19C|nr:odontogenic ameloblast-associated protein [Sarcophilus harrisii]
MRTLIFLGFLGVTFAAPFIPQPLLSASNSNEPRTQTPGLSQISWLSLGHFGGLVPNQIPFPGQIKLAQRTQAIQQEPSQLQTLQQNQQDFYQMIPCFFSYGLPQVWGQMVQYYPICVYGPQDLPPQFFPLQAEQPQPQEQVSPGGQQQMNFDLLRGDIPESPGMPIENILPYPQRDIVNLGYPNAGIFMPSHTSKHQTANILAPATDTDNIIPVELMEEKLFEGLRDCDFPRVYTSGFQNSIGLWQNPNFGNLPSAFELEAPPLFYYVASLLSQDKGALDADRCCG